LNKNNTYTLSRKTRNTSLNTNVVVLMLQSLKDTQVLLQDWESKLIFWKTSPPKSSLAHPVLSQVYIQVSHFLNFEKAYFESCKTCLCIIDLHLSEINQLFFQFNRLILLDYIWIDWLWKTIHYFSHSI